ncbi:MAG TPA: hypothetical protein P5571_15705 [Candidatus Krumholzibacteria bacterium]|nr:hypothetical protein [Candidatus Krumholzibacteria bacterium]HRX52814.1 hypothetical protein [Candidatus Krumholzibacteria bacterium]
MIRHLMNGAALAAGNMLGIVLGFYAFALFRNPNQQQVQIPVAVIASVVVFLIWARFANVPRRGRLGLRGRRDGVLAYALALPVAAAAFVPLHYLFSGYLTAASNIVAGWLFMLLANPLVVGVAVAAAGDETAAGPTVVPHS